MQLHCPCCGEQFPFESGFADADGKRLAALLAEVDPKLGRSVLNYLRLFSTGKRGLRLSRAVRLVEDLLELVKSGQVQRDSRTNEVKPATPKAWLDGVERVLATRERLQLPLENHNYLRAVVYGVVSEPTQIKAPAPAKPISAAASARQKLQEEIGRIDADLRLGLIDELEAERRRKEIRRSA